MDIMTTITFEPVRSHPCTSPMGTLHSPSPGQQQIIAMLHGQGRISDQDAHRLSEKPFALDDILMLSMLHDRHDLSDVEYEIEKGCLLA